MKLPENIEKVSISKTDIPLGPYPSLGFVPIYEAELGNGDYFGLYWPLGREQNEPIICDMLHDEWALEPCFSSLDKFIEWLELNDWGRGDEDVDDNEFSPYLYNKAKSLLSSSDIEQPIELLRKACDAFPEVSDYWFTLSSQLKRAGKLEESVNAALKAFNSNWLFGLPSQGVMRILQNPKTKELIDNDPLLERMNELSMNFGGTKENSNYSIMAECIREYFNAKKYVEGLILYQNYGYMMYMETKSFQERYNFVLENWRSEFSELCSKYLNDNRKYGS